MSARRFTINDSDRAQWVDNDEGLYNMWRRSRMSKTAFVRANRAEIDAVINRVVHRVDTAAHHLGYGGWRKRRPEHAPRKSSVEQERKRRKFQAEKQHRDGLGRFH